MSTIIGKLDYGQDVEKRLGAFGPIGEQMREHEAKNQLAAALNCLHAFGNTEDLEEATKHAKRIAAKAMRRKQLSK